MRIDGRTVRAVNRLTARWAGEASADRAGTAFSAVGVWPLLAFLADGAGGRAREELAGAVGLDAGEAAGAARELLAALEAEPALRLALGLWTRRTLEIRSAWLDRLAPGTHGVLTGDPRADSAALDAWAAGRTGGEIGRVPVPVHEDTEMVLATALTVATEWHRPFLPAGDLVPGSGPWRDRAFPALYRSGAVPDRLDLADTPHGAVTGLTVMGRAGVDVRLLLGEEPARPGRMLGCGLDVLERRRPVVRGGELPFGEPGPGIEVRRALRTWAAPPTLEVTTVPFAVTGDHDLTRHPRLFGLTAFLDAGQGHLPGVSGQPLALGAAAQTATAAFGEHGFRASAVTAFAMAAGGAAPSTRYRVTEVRVRFDRPFGFLAVHRRSGLVLAAGWVSEPAG
ncbi:serpin family protein [Streptomyces fragilis]|uniref:Serpin family protein n=1 Tax=Streptomyces fragilis TaxID=67301 RepID=A0ABV2YLW6_9ACTN|nr:serpin family protein [Streptomyces fragilis]